MQRKPHKVVNRHLAATSVVRLIEAIQPKTEDMPANVIMKPKPQRKRLPASKLLIKVSKEKAKKKNRPVRATGDIDMAAVEDALDDVMADLN
jgi:hypothetical protein